MFYFVDNRKLNNLFKIVKSDNKNNITMNGVFFFSFDS